MGKAAEAEADLNSVDAGVGAVQAGVGDVHEAELRAEIVFAAQEVRADSAAGGEIYMRSVWRSFDVGEEGAAADINVGNYIVVAGEIPLEREGVDAGAIGRASGLSDDEDGNHIDGVFEAAFEEAGAVGVEEDPAEAGADVEDAVAGLAAVGAVAAAGPDLQVVAAFFGAGLGAGFCDGKN